MSEGPKEPAPPYHSNVVSGDAIKKLVSQGYRTNGVSHRFRMTWPCGHAADAIEVVGPGGGLKACATCAQAYGLR